MFDTRTSLSFFACQKDAAGAALKSRLSAPASKKNLLRLHLKSSGSGSATLTTTNPWKLNLLNQKHIKKWEILIIQTQYVVIKIFNTSQINSSEDRNAARDLLTMQSSFSMLWA